MLGKKENESCWVIRMKLNVRMENKEGVVEKLNSIKKKGPH